MARFRKKPVEVDAVAATNAFDVDTLEGKMNVNRGDIIITGVAGEMYPCRLDIFLKTYEAIDDEGHQVIDLAMKVAHPEVIKAAKQGVTLIALPD